MSERGRLLLTVLLKRGDAHTLASTAFLQNNTKKTSTLFYNFFINKDLLSVTNIYFNKLHLTWQEVDCYRSDAILLTRYMIIWQLILLCGTLSLCQVLLHHNGPQGVWACSITVWCPPGSEATSCSLHQEAHHGSHALGGTPEMESRRATWIHKSWGRVGVRLLLHHQQWHVMTIEETLSHSLNDRA